MWKRIQFFSSVTEDAQMAIKMACVFMEWWNNRLDIPEIYVAVHRPIGLLVCVCVCSAVCCCRLKSASSTAMLICLQSLQRRATWTASTTDSWQSKCSTMTSLYVVVTTWAPAIFTYLYSVLWRCWLGGGKASGLLKKMLGCWHGYLSGARCRLADSAADASATHCLLLQQNPDWFTFLVLAYLVSRKRGR